MSPDEAANELYGSAPKDFVAARNALVSRLAAGRDRETAALIRAFPRPSAGAWAVNLLQRNASSALDDLTDLGVRYREAEQRFDRAALIELGRQRRKLVAGLLAHARQLTDAAKHPLNAAALAEIEQTLRAVVADPGAASAVGSGRLVAGVRSDGVEAVDLVGAVAGAEPMKRSPRKYKPGEKPSVPDAARRQADADTEEALAAWEAAEASRAELAEELEHLDRDATVAKSVRDNLEAELQRANETLTAANDAANAARLELNAAADTARARKRNSDAARRRADRLGSK